MAPLVSARQTCCKHSQVAGEGQWHRGMHAHSTLDAGTIAVDGGSKGVTRLRDSTL